MSLNSGQRPQRTGKTGHADTVGALDGLDHAVSIGASGQGSDEKSLSAHIEGEVGVNGGIENEKRSEVHEEVRDAQWATRAKKRREGKGKTVVCCCCCV